MIFSKRQNTNILAPVGAAPPSTKKSGFFETSDSLGFMHFEKTGGTTIHDLLSPHFDPNESCPERFGNLSRLPIDSIKNYRFFSGHIRYSDFRFVDKPIKLITWLRNPIERSISLYFYWRSYRDDVVNALGLKEPKLAKSMSLSEFYSKENSDRYNFLWNTYTRWLLIDEKISQRGNILQSEEEVIYEALSALDTFYFVGITEYMFFSLDHLSKKMNMEINYTGQQINMSDVNYLNNPEVFSPLEKHTVTCKELEIIAAANELDMQIYEYAHKRFLKDISGEYVVPGKVGAAEICKVINRRSEVWVANQTGGIILFGQDIRLPPGRYTIEFRFRRVLWPTDTDELIGVADVFSKNTGIIYAEEEIHQSQYGREAEQTIAINFDLIEVVKDIEFRFHANPSAKIEVYTSVTLRISLL